MSKSGVYKHKNNKPHLNKNKNYIKSNKFNFANKNQNLGNRKPNIKSKLDVSKPKLKKIDTKLLPLRKRLKYDLKFYILKQSRNPNFKERRKIFKKLLPTKSVFKVKGRNVRNNNKFLTQKNFVTFLNKNNLYNTFNLRQDFPYPNYLQTKSEIQRATIFRDLINKEEAYYNAFSKSPLVVLLSPKPKNIYMTVYTLPESPRGYKIYWKKSAGMLQKVEGQLSFPALVELFNKLNIFLTKNFLELQNPIRLIIKSTKYYGTNHLIQNFVKIHEKNINLNYIYFMYKYRKRFNFFNNYATLINDSVFNYISSIWLKFLKLLRRTKLPTNYIFSKKDFKVFNKFFGIEYDFTRRRHKINHLARLKRLKSLKNKKFKKKSSKLASQHVYQR